MSRTTFVPVAPGWYVSNTGGIALTGLLAALTGRRALWFVFWAGSAAHVAEAAVAYRKAQAAGFTESAPRWALQTLAVGFPSLLVLIAAIDESTRELGPEV